MSGELNMESLRKIGEEWMSEDGRDALEDWIAAAPVSSPIGEELPVLPDAWGTMYGNGETLDERTGYTADQMRGYAFDAIAPYAARIRQLERELKAVRTLADLRFNEVLNLDADKAELIDRHQRDLAERKTASIGDSVDFQALLSDVMVASKTGQTVTVVAEKVQALIAYIDGRTTGAVPEEAKRPAPNTDVDPAYDPLYDKAVMIIRARNRASVSLVQRELLIGYNRASRLFDAMESAGVISPVSVDGYRTVLAAAPTPMNSGKEEGK